MCIRDRLRTLLPLVSKWGTLSVFPLAFIFVFYPQNVISALFGNEYARAAMVLPILVVGLLPHIMNGKSGETLKAGGHTKKILLIVSVTAAVNIALNLVMIPWLGIMGAAFATATSFFAMGLLYIITLKREMGLSPFSRNYAIQIALSVVICGVLLVLNNSANALGVTGATILIGDLVLFYPLLLIANKLTGGLEEGDEILLQFTTTKLKQVVRRIH